MEKYIVINEFNNYAVSNFGNIKNIKKNKEYIKKARALYNSAFPSAERIPFDILLCIY